MEPTQQLPEEIHSYGYYIRFHFEKDYLLKQACKHSLTSFIMDIFVATDVFQHVQDTFEN